MSWLLLAVLAWSLWTTVEAVLALVARLRRRSALSRASLSYWCGAGACR